MKLTEESLALANQFYKLEWAVEGLGRLEVEAELRGLSPEKHHEYLVERFRAQKLKIYEEFTKLGKQIFGGEYRL